MDVDFFAESSSEEDEECSKQRTESDDFRFEEPGVSFKFNVDHSLNIFNILKNGGTYNSYFDAKRGPNNNSQNSYVYLNA